jgi:hypothetical protein
VSILPSSGLLRSVRCFDTDVSGLPIGPILKKPICSRFQTTLRCVTTQKTEDMSSTAGKPKMAWRQVKKI